ncbi:MAG: hypothetical protein ACREBK_07645, partial [Sphingomicrobium sp.]
VPTGKDGLLSFLNAFAVDAMHGEAKAMIEAARPVSPAPLSYADRSVGGDDWFEKLPVEHMLTLTSLALENARTEIAKLKQGGRAHIDPMDLDPDTGRPYSNYSSPSLDTSLHDGEMDVDDDCEECGGSGIASGDYTFDAGDGEGEDRPCPACAP